MSKKIPVQTRGILSQLRDVLTNDWQSLRLICAQIAFPPEAIIRSVAKNTAKADRWNCTESGAKTSITSRFINDLVVKGYVERRKSPIDGKYEYRLSQTTKQEIQK